MVVKEYNKQAGVYKVQTFRTTHPIIFRSDGRNRINAMSTMNAANNSCCLLCADLNLDSQSSSQKFSSPPTALPQTTQCLCGAVSVI